MPFPAVGLIVFIVCFCLHMVLWRVQEKLHLRPLGVVFPYALGIIALFVLWAYGPGFGVESTFVIITTICFILAGILLVYYSLAMSLEGQTPSSLILLSFAKSRTQNISRLEAIFTNEKLLWQRVEDLVRVGLVRHIGNRYMLTLWGWVVYRCITLYALIFSRTERG